MALGPLAPLAFNSFKPLFSSIGADIDIKQFVLCCGWASKSRLDNDPIRLNMHKFLNTFTKIVKSRSTLIIS